MKNIIITLFALFALSSCAKESFLVGEISEGEVTMKLSLSTKSLTPMQEMQIDRVRIIVFNGGAVKFNQIVSATPDNSYIVRTVYGVSQYYAVCNETPEMTAKLNVITSVANLEAITFAAPLTAPFAMYGMMSGGVKRAGEDIVVDYDGRMAQTKLMIGVDRLAAKASLSFIKNSTTINKISNLEVSVHQRPVFAFLGEGKNNNGSQWIPSSTIVYQTSSAKVLYSNSTYERLVSDNVFEGFTINGEHLDMVDFYIPENILANVTDNTRNTYLEVTADCEMTSGATTSTKWRIDFIKEGDYGVIRNHHYHILATIQDVGAMDLYADILPVTEVDVEIGWGLIEGLSIVSDRTDRYGANDDVWNNFDKLTGILKVYTPASETEPEKYHDVVFKYGSVLAIEADNNPYAADKILWCPPDYVKPANYADVPFTATGSINAGQTDGTNISTNIDLGKGDPCRLVRLSRKQIQAGVVDNYQWRMMTEEEMERLITANDAQDPSVNYIDTKGYYAYHSWLIPKTIARDATTGNAIASGNYGFYWTGQDAKAFTFTAGNQTAGNQSIAVDNPSKAGTVRCIRTSVPEKVKSVITHTVSNNAITYQGGVKDIYLTTNIPYWTAQVTGLSVTERTTGAPISPAPSLDNISFDSGNTNRLTATGMNSETLSAYIKRYESSTHRSVYTITITGFGYDGQTLNRTITVAQAPFDWIVRVMSISGATGAAINGKPSVAQAGETLSAIVQIQPLDVLLPTQTALSLKVDAYFTTNKINGSNNTIANLFTAYPNINVLSNPANRSIQLDNIVVDTNNAPNPRNIFVIPALSNLPYVIPAQLSITQEAN